MYRRHRLAQDVEVIVLLTDMTDDDMQMRMRNLLQKLHRLFVG